MKVLLAVSGGIDSMYMLHRAPELFPGASFAVAHCNFALRGAESDGDEAFVREECGKIGVECFTRRFDTLGYSSEHGVSVEMAARELRYAWFAALCREHSFDVLATAHNANDNAETLILNLLRGSGSKGLRGIPSGGCVSQGAPSMEASGGCSFTLNAPSMEASGGCVPQGVSPKTSASLRPSHCAALVGPSHSRGHGRPRFSEIHPASTTPPEGLSVILSEGEAEVEKSHSSAVRIVRPLLGTTREEIRAWMEKNGFRWREDSTNAEDGARRNKIRNRVFPVFAEINPSFVRTLGEDIERIRQTDDIADDYFREAAARIVKRAPDACGGAILEISVKGLLELKHWRYVLWRILEDCSFNAETFGKLCALLERYRTEPSGTVTLSGKTFQSPTHTLRARKKLLLLF